MADTDGASSPNPLGRLRELIAIFGQLGDVVASAFKRQAEVKDYGVLLPTFGGMLDRFDAFILAAPVFYYLVKFASAS